MRVETINKTHPYAFINHDVMICGNDEKTRAVTEYVSVRVSSRFRSATDLLITTIVLFFPTFTSMSLSLMPGMMEHALRNARENNSWPVIIFSCTDMRLKWEPFPYLIIVVTVYVNPRHQSNTSEKVKENNHAGSRVAKKRERRVNTDVWFSFPILSTHTCIGTCVVISSRLFRRRERKNEEISILLSIRIDGEHRSYVDETLLVIYTGSAY